MKNAIAILLLTSSAFAESPPPPSLFNPPASLPARRIRLDVAPSGPPQVTPIGQVIDTRRPAFTPSFVERPATSPLQTERDWANTHTIPPAVYFIYSYRPYGYGGWGGWGGWGGFGGYRSHGGLIGHR